MEEYGGGGKSYWAVRFAVVAVLCLAAAGLRWHGDEEARGAREWAARPAAEKCLAAYRLWEHGYELKEEDKRALPAPAVCEELLGLRRRAETAGVNFGQSTAFAPPLPDSLEGLARLLREAESTTRASSLPHARIKEFRASADVIAPGESVTLTYGVEEASLVTVRDIATGRLLRLPREVPPGNGLLVIAPATTRKYRLTASTPESPETEESAELTVYVGKR